MKIALTKFLALAGTKGIGPALATLNKETSRELADLQNGYNELQRERVAASNAGDDERAQALSALSAQAYTLIDMLKDQKRVVLAAQRKPGADAI